MNTLPTSAVPPSSGGDAVGMLDEPSLSRQWVARRLQRALSVERWGAPLRHGLSRAGGPAGVLLAEHARASEQRARHLDTLIRSVGSEPYAAAGIGGAMARAGAGLAARLARRASRNLAKRLAEHTLAEYETLAAFVEDAPGIAVDVGVAIVPLRDQVRAELDALAVC